jgi:hypothetical protein
MLRQWLARCLFCGRARRLRDFDWRCAFVRLKLFKAQFEWLDLTVKLLRLATERHTAQLGNEQFQVFEPPRGGSEQLWRLSEILTGVPFRPELALIPLRSNDDLHLKSKRVIECRSDC